MGLTALKAAGATEFPEIKMKKLMWSAIATVMLGASAHAADLPQPEIVQAPPAEVQVASVSGWYLRGDVGYQFNQLRGARYFQGSNDTDVDFTTAKQSDSWSIGGGVGYQVNQYLRADVTLDYGFRSTFTGSTTGGCGVAVNCVSTDISHLTTLSLLANAYAELGTYGSVTPYVGAGIGGTHLTWDGLRNTSCEVGNPNNCDPTEFHEGKKSWRFTWALMAGASVDVTCNLKADVGYRYRHVSAGDMFGYKNNGGPGYDKGFDIHEVRGGMRYQFGNGGCGEVALAPPAPLPVYK